MSAAQAPTRTTAEQLATLLGHPDDAPPDATTALWLPGPHGGTLLYGRGAQGDVCGPLADALQRGTTITGPPRLFDLTAPFERCELAIDAIGVSLRARRDGTRPRAPASATLSTGVDAVIALLEQIQAAITDQHPTGWGLTAAGRPLLDDVDAQLRELIISLDAQASGPVPDADGLGRHLDRLERARNALLRFGLLTTLDGNAVSNEAEGLLADALCAAQATARALRAGP